MKKKNKYLIFTFILFLVILSLCPIAGDDWSNYLEGTQGLRHILGQTYGMYLSWEGRIVSRFLINIFTCSKIAWNITNSLCIVLMVYGIVKLLKPKHKKLVYILSVLILLLMNIYTFSQVITWIAGNITYFIEIPFIIIYLYFLVSDKHKKKMYFKICTILAILIPMFVEHMAIIMIAIPGILALYKYIKDRKVDVKLLTLMVISIISSLFVFLSPGNASRLSQENEYFNSLSIFGKINYNISNFIYYTFTINTYEIILLSLSIYLIIKNKFNKGISKLLLNLYLIVPPIVIGILYLISNFITLPISIYTNNIFVVIYTISYILIYLYLLYRSENRLALFIYVLALLANGVMLASPVWGNRTGAFTYIFIAISAISIIDMYYKDNKALERILEVLIILSSLFYIVFYINVYRCQKDIEKDIKTQLKENSEVIRISSFPSFANCNINPTNDYHLTKFKEYYKIPEDKEIELVEGNWKYVIIYKK